MTVIIPITLEAFDDRRKLWTELVDLEKRLTDRGYTVPQRLRVDVIDLRVVEYDVQIPCLLCKKMFGDRKRIYDSGAFSGICGPCNVQTTKEVLQRRG